MGMFLDYNVTFSYERISLVCYLCGVVGHSASSCPMLIDFPDGLVVYEWPEIIRAKAHCFSVSNVEGVLSGEGSSIVDKGESLDRDQLPKVVKSSVGLTGNGSGRGEVNRTCLHGAVSLAKGVLGESGVRLVATGTTFALGLSSSELLIVSSYSSNHIDVIVESSNFHKWRITVFMVQDKWGGVSYLDNICRRFQDCIADCGLIEVSLLGPFTWERGRGTAHFVMERLAMAFANARWMQMFPYFKLFNLVSATLDHNPSNGILLAFLIFESQIWELKRQIATIALDYFVQLFSTSIEAGFHNFSNFPSSVRTVHNASLLAPFTEGEFKTSMEMHPDKSSGPNGLSLAFYQQCWPIVGS
ncbi:hypothetical protein Golob_026767, partial [Gossypium lobatum]|nr:hypothetical protein [Gossypium lobatum]